MWFLSKPSCRKHMMFSQRKSGRRSGFQITGTGNKRHQQCGKDERGNKKKIYSLRSFYFKKLVTLWSDVLAHWPVSSSAYWHFYCPQRVQSHSIACKSGMVFEIFVFDCNIYMLTIPKRIFYFLNVMSPPYSALCIASKVVCILYRK